MTPLFGNDFALRLDTFIGYKSKPSSLYQHAFVFDLNLLSFPPVAIFRPPATNTLIS